MLELVNDSNKESENLTKTSNERALALHKYEEKTGTSRICC